MWLSIVIFNTALNTVHTMMLPVTVVFVIPIVRYKLVLLEKKFGWRKKKTILIETSTAFLIKNVKQTWSVRTVSNSLRFSSNSVVMSSWAFFKYDRNTSLSCFILHLEIIFNIQYWTNSHHYYLLSLTCSLQSSYRLPTVVSSNCHYLIWAAAWPIATISIHDHVLSSGPQFHR